VTQNITVIKKTLTLTGPTTPLYGSIVIMCLILSGFLIYFGIDCYLERKR
jgi:hypothetical protein